MNKSVIEYSLLGVVLILLLFASTNGYYNVRGLSLSPVDEDGGNLPLNRGFFGINVKWILAGFLIVLITEMLVRRAKKRDSKD